MNIHLQLIGGGPSKLPSKYHTVLDLPRKRSGSKRSPLGWRLLFGSKTGRKNSPRKQNNKLDDENNQQVLKLSLLLFETILF